MSNNPYVNINRVIDTSSDQRKVVDFLHQKTFTDVEVLLTSFVAAEPSEISEGNFYADIEKTDLTFDSSFILKETHLPIVVLAPSENLTLDKDNFPTCKTMNNGSEVVIRLYATAIPASIEVTKITIPVVMLVEVK